MAKNNDELSKALETITKNREKAISDIDDFNQKINGKLITASKKADEILSDLDKLMEWREQFLSKVTRGKK